MSNAYDYQEDPNLAGQFVTMGEGAAPDRYNDEPTARIVVRPPSVLRLPEQEDTRMSDALVRMGAIGEEPDRVIAPESYKPAPAWATGLVEGARDYIKRPGQMMERNPYPEGSEQADYYDLMKTKNEANFAGETAVNTLGTGGIVGVPMRAGETVLGAGAVRTRAKPKMSAAVEEPSVPMGSIAGSGHNLPPTGSLNPLDNVTVTFRGKEPKDMTPQELEDWGNHYGVKNLGLQSAPQTFKDLHGNEFNIPGGTEGTWSHRDLLDMKANPINPANVDRVLHAEMQRKLGRTMTPQELSDADVWNGLVFGMTSPNNPLFPNQATASRLRLRTPEMLDDLASMIPWKAGEQVPAAQRKLANDAIAVRFGIGSAPETGGIGTRGTADYTRVAEMAQMFKKDPAFFRKQPNESWEQAVERISSQLPGLSMKTGSFGTVWQDPANAAISAIDRHMARELEARGGIFASPEERAAWEQRSVNLWNEREKERVIEQTAQAKKAAGKNAPARPVAPADLATDFADMSSKSGADGHLGEMLLSHVGKAGKPKFRDAKTGEISKAVPPHLAQANWVVEPEQVFRMGKAYRQALDVNQKLADQNNLKLFMSQWMEWDRIRNRFEPHENMFPGLSKLPAQSIEQLRAVDRAHLQTGHKNYDKSEEGLLKPTKPYLGNPAQMGLYSMGGIAAIPAAKSYLDEER
jgi:hypothetical protein